MLITQTLQLIFPAPTFYYHIHKSKKTHEILKISNICVVRILKGDRTENGVEAVFEVIIAQQFLKVMSYKPADSRSVHLKQNKYKENHIKIQ